MVCEDTLRIRNLPPNLSNEEIEDLFQHFGATNVKIIVSTAKEKTVVFAKFDSKEIAKNVMLRLHQISILNSRLCVEFASLDIGQGKPPIKPVENVKETNKNQFRTFVNKLTAWNSSVGFHQPPPAHLKYTYPKPNRATINNIAHALASVPKFYTQVLHLMNKMNLPPPFAAVPDVPVQNKEEDNKAAVPASETSESELESDPEDVDRKTKEIIPEKRSFPHKKTVKRPKFIKPPVTTSNSSSKPQEKAEEIFEKVDMQSQPKIEMKLKNDFSFLESKTSENENVHIINAEEINREIKSSAGAIISEEELNSNRIPQKEFSALPAFKDYHPGMPTSKLYIKNIAKTVEVSDLEHIYKRFIENNSDCDKEVQFNVRLMQEGRMKGQAFITFDSVEQAEKALKETNGFILKDKPLVVVFAKSGVSKK